MVQNLLGYRTGMVVIIDNQGSELLDVRVNRGFKHRNLFLPVHPHRKVKRTADTKHALHPNCAVHSLNQTFTNGEPQPRPTKTSCGTAISLHKRRKEHLNLLVREANTGITDRKLQLHLGFSSGQRFHPKMDFTFFGKFDGIFRQVGQHLLQA